MRTALIVPAVLGAAALGLGACRRGEQAPPPTAVDAAVPLDMIFPAYPVVEGPDDPPATRLCAALHGIPARQRRTCCAQQRGAAPAVDHSADCARTLSLALRGHAVSVDEAAIDGCAAALAPLYAACDFVGCEPLELPPACRGLVHGRLPERWRCRSSIECEGQDHCEGLGAGTTGVCRPPGGHGILCSASLDPLAALLLDDRLDETHPVCAGHCERGRCATPITPGGPCAATFHCGPGYHCSRQRCVAGWRPGAGDPCEGPCDGLARCVKGTCVAAAALKEGAPCASDEECAGRCVIEGEHGRCGSPCAR